MTRIVCDTMTLRFALRAFLVLIALAVSIATIAVAGMAGGVGAAVLVGLLYAVMGIDTAWRVATGRG
jgi:hypothetical protein